MNKKTALYVRTSTEMQVNGLDAQLKALQEYCNQRQITDYEVYKDFGVSGAKLSRPGLDLLMNRVRLGQISTVIVYSFSRFARSTKGLILALEEFQSFEVAFISYTEAIDTTTPMGKTMFSIIASLGELERSLIRERVTNGLKAAKARGKKLGAPKLNVNSELLLNLKLQNLSYKEIGKMLGISPASVCRRLKEVQISEIKAL